MTDSTVMVDELFRCPVIGLCLSTVEQRCLLKKAGIRPDGFSRYQMHEVLVSSLEGDNVLSRRVIRLLKLRYEHRAAALRGLPWENFMEVWEEALASGDYRAELWAAATRALPEEPRHSLRGQLHMSMHDTLADKSGLKIMLDDLEKKLRRRDAKLEAARRELDDSHRELATLRQTCVRLQCERDEAFCRRDAVLGQLVGAQTHCAVQEENAFLKAEVARLSVEVREYEEMFLALPTVDAATEFAPQGLANAAFFAPACGDRACGADCPSFNLCSKRVLIVGGIERMESAYRKLVEEENGGILEYHPGHVGGGGKKQLESSLRRADMVLCPVNCNSHGACKMVKSLAKKYSKPVHMMHNFSVSAVSGVISNYLGEGAA